MFRVIDDILIFSRNQEEHAAHLRILLQRFSEYGVVINASKCIFSAPSPTFLGCKVSAEGIQAPPEDKFADLRAYPKPKTVKMLHNKFICRIFMRRPASTSTTRVPQDTAPALLAAPKVTRTTNPKAPIPHSERVEHSKALNSIKISRQSDE